MLRIIGTRGSGHGRTVPIDPFCLHRGTLPLAVVILDRPPGQRTMRPAGCGTTDAATQRARCTASNARPASGTTVSVVVGSMVHDGRPGWIASEMSVQLGPQLQFPLAMKRELFSPDEASRSVSSTEKVSRIAPVSAKESSPCETQSSPSRVPSGPSWV